MTDALLAAMQAARLRCAHARFVVVYRDGDSYTFTDGRAAPAGTVKLATFGIALPAADGGLALWPRARRKK